MPLSWLSGAASGEGVVVIKMAAGVNGGLCYYRAVKTLNHRIIGTKVRKLTGAKMNFLKVNGGQFYVTQTGGKLPILLFAHGFLMNHSMFAAQVRQLCRYFNCVCYDQRSHGNSEPSREEYDMDLLVDDACALIEQLGAPVHFCGMSAGGFVGMRIGVRRPELLASLVLMDTAAAAEPPSFLRQYRLMMWVVRRFGWRQFILNKVMRVLFDHAYLHNPQNRTQVQHWQNIIQAHDKWALLAFANAIFARDDVSGLLGGIHLPTLIVAGENDRSTPVAKSQQMHQLIARSQLTIIPNAAHTAAIEQGDAVGNAMLDFYRQQGIIPL